MLHGILEIPRHLKNLLKLVYEPRGILKIISFHSSLLEPSYITCVVVFLGIKKNVTHGASCCEAWVVGESAKSRKVMAMLFSKQNPFLDDLGA